MALVNLPDSKPLLDSSQATEHDEPRPELAGSEEHDNSASSARMPFLDHLDELRKRLVISFAAILVGFLISFSVITYIFEFIMLPLQEVLPDGGRLVYTEPAEAFLLYIKIAALAGLILSMPVVLSQFWLFVAPGLYSHEKKFAIPFVSLSTMFFMGGVSFSHFVVFPWAWGFFAGFGTDYMEFLPRIGSVFSLYVKMLLVFGVIFQMPMLVLFLSRIGAVTAKGLIRNTKYAILSIFIIAAVLTPTPDPVTQTMMAGPMIALYGISILIAWIFEKDPTK